MGMLLACLLAKGKGGVAAHKFGYQTQVTIAASVSVQLGKATP